MKHTLSILMASTAVLTAATAQAQEAPVDLGTLILSGGLSPVEEQAFGRSASVITGEEITERGITTVQNALRALPGVAVNSTGETFTQVRIRGGEGNHVLVLIDGVEANVQSFGEYIFTGLMVDDIERIEVLRGPQSAIYGSNAMSGVISITTRRAREPGLAYGVGAEVGGQESYAANGSVSYRGIRGGIALSLATRDTEGEDASRTGGDKEFNDRTTLSLNGDYALTDTVTLGFSGRRIWQEFGYDSTSSDPANGPDDYIVDAPITADRDELYASVWVEADAFSNRMTNRLTLSGSEFETENFDDSVFTFGDDQSRRLLALSGSYALDNVSLDNANHRLNYVVEAEEESLGENDRERQAVALEYQGDVGNGYTVQLGARRDLNDVFEDATTWSVSGAYQFLNRDIKLRAAAGRATVEPTIFEQFGFVPGVFEGNPDLEPEESLGYEVGADFGFANAANLSITLFNNDVENLIQGFGETAVNVEGTSTRRGTELAFDVQARDWLGLSGAYTYLQAEAEDGTRLVRRPEHELGLQAVADIFDGRGTAAVDVRHVAGNFDTARYDGSNEIRELPAFTTINLATSYDLTNSVKLTGRVVNLTDIDASEAWGYYAQSRTFYVGVNANW